MASIFSNEHKVIEKLKELREMYEKLLSLALEVKQENTSEFMRYWEEEIDNHLKFLGVKELRIGVRGKNG